MVGFASGMGEFGIGQSIKRFEDVRLLRGEGRFHADAKDVDVVSQGLWAAVHGVVSLHIAMAGPDDPFIEWKPARKTAQLVVDAMVRGLSTNAGVSRVAD